MKPCHNKFCTLEATHIEHNVALPRYFCSKGCQLASHIQALDNGHTHAIVLVQAGTKRLPTDDKESEDEKKRPKPEVEDTEEEVIIPLPEPEVELDPITLEPIANLRGDPSSILYMPVGGIKPQNWDLDALMRWVHDRLPFNKNSSIVVKNPASNLDFTVEEEVLIIDAANARRDVLEQQLVEYAGARNMAMFREKYRLLVKIYGYKVHRPWATRIYLAGGQEYFELLLDDVSARHSYAFGQVVVNPISDFIEDIEEAYAPVLQNMPLPKVRTMFGTVPTMLWQECRASWSVDDEEVGETTFSDATDPVDIGVEEIDAIALDEEPHRFVLAIEYEAHPPPVIIKYPKTSALRQLVAPTVTAYDLANYNHDAHAWRLEPFWKREQSVLDRYADTHYLEIVYWLPDSPEPKKTRLPKATDNPYPVIFEIIHNVIVYGPVLRTKNGKDGHEIRIEISEMPKKQK